MTHPRILIVRLGALGDVLLTLAALRRLRRSLPGAYIAWLVEERHATVLEGSPDLDRVWRSRSHAWRRAPVRPGTWREVRALVNGLRGERFDLAIDLQGLVKSSVWARLSGAPVRLGLPRGRTRERASGVFYNLRLGGGGEHGNHVTDLYTATVDEGVRCLGGEPVASDETGLMVLGEIETRWAEDRVAGLDGDLVVVSPGAQWVTKRWPPERFAELAHRLASEGGRWVLVAHGPGEEGLARSIVELAGHERVFTQPSDVRQLAALLRRARLFVGGDTGPYHLARVMGTPTVALFGATDPSRNGPRAASDTFVWGQPPCAPCYRRRCPTAIECMDAITVEATLARCQEQLRGQLGAGNSRRTPDADELSATSRQSSGELQ